MERLALERKNLVDNVKKLDEAMLALRSVAGTSPAVAQRFPSVLAVAGRGAQERRSGRPAATPRLHRAAGRSARDGRQCAGDGRARRGRTGRPSAAPAPAAAAPAGEWVEPGRRSRPSWPPSPSPSAARRHAAAVGPAAGWTVGKSGEHHLETFNADNLYEKIDGRAESFIQYGVKGMAYAFYHPTGDPSNELQLYIFEMADPLKALGKYGSEKPDEFQAGRRSATRATPPPAARCSTRASTTRRSSRPQDDPKFAAFALDLAKRVVARQKPGGAASRRRPRTGAGPAAAADRRPADQAHDRPTETKPAAEAKPAAAEVTPATFFALLPAQSREGDPKYVAQDVFGYSFLSDVFMADYKEGNVAWQGFLRPYRDAQEAKAVFEKYIAGVKKDGAEVKTLTAEGADEMVVSNNIGLVDVVFRKGNTLAGANGATSRRARRGLRPCAGQEPAGHRADPRWREVSRTHRSWTRIRGDDRSSALTLDGLPR